MTKTPSFEELFWAEYPRLLSAAVNWTQNRTEAEDLVMVTMRKLYVGFPDYDGKRPFRNWALRALGNAALDRRRTLNRRIQTCSYDDYPVDFGAFAGPEPEVPGLSPRLEWALAQLTPRQARILSIVINDKPLIEVAREEGMPEGTVRSRLYRTRRFIQDLLTLPEKDARALAEKQARRLPQSRHLTA